MTSGRDLFARLTPAKADRRPHGYYRAAPPWFQVVIFVAKVGGVVALYWLIGWWSVLLSASLLGIVGALTESFSRSARFAVTTSVRTWALRVLGPGVWVLAATTMEPWYLRLFLVASAVPFGVSLLRRSQSHDESSSVMMRNQRAHATYVNLQNDEKAACEPFCLYLRPFASERRLLVEVPASLHPAGLHHLDFEAVLCRALRGHSLVLSLGKESEELDLAARIDLGIDVGEKEWRDAVKVLARHAGLIVIVPLHYKGTEWELYWLIDSGLSDKIVCVLPESSYPMSGLGWSFFRISAGVDTKPLRAPLVVAHIFGLCKLKLSFGQNAQSLEEERETAFLDFLKITMELPLEWRRFMECGKGGRFSLPILTATGALFRTGSDPATPGRIFPLALSLVRHKEGWLRQALTALGLLPGLGDSGAVSWIRAVLGQSKDPWLLLLCADSFVVWDMLKEAIECFTLVRGASQQGREMARRYLTAIPILISEREAMLGIQLRSSYDRFVARLLDTDQQWERHPELRAACTVSLPPDEDARNMAARVLGPAFVEFKEELARASENPPG